MLPPTDSASIISRPPRRRAHHGSAGKWCCLQVHAKEEKKPRKPFRLRVDRDSRGAQGLRWGSCFNDTLWTNHLTLCFGESVPHRAHQATCILTTALGTEPAPFSAQLPDSRAAPLRDMAGRPKLTRPRPSLSASMRNRIHDRIEMWRLSLPIAQSGITSAVYSRRILCYFRTS